MRAAVALPAALLISVTTPGPLDRIAAGESASAVLDGWCVTHGLPHLHARRLLQRKTPDAGVRAALEAGRGAPIAYRRVRLACGERTMSEADNWYLPSLLSPEMNRQLAVTDTPFGLVVKPLAFRRQTLNAAPDARGRFVIRAELLDRAGAPFSYVVEHYRTLRP